MPALPRLYAGKDGARGGRGSTPRYSCLVDPGQRGDPAGLPVAPVAEQARLFRGATRVHADLADAGFGELAPQSRLDVEAGRALASTGGAARQVRLDVLRHVRGYL